MYGGPPSSLQVQVVLSELQRSAIVTHDVPAATSDPDWLAAATIFEHLHFPHLERGEGDIVNVKCELPRANGHPHLVLQLADGPSIEARFSRCCTLERP